MRKKYNKLIRDKIPKIIKEDDADPEVIKLSEKRYKEELKNKLIEEAKEVTETKSREEVIAELADLQELIDYITATHNIPEEQIKKAQKEKNERKGGFEDRLFLKYVDEK